MPERPIKQLELTTGRKVAVYQSIRTVALARQGISVTDAVTTALNPDDHTEQEVVEASDKLILALLAEPLDLSDLEDSEWTELTKYVGQTLFPASDATFPEDGGTAPGNDGDTAQPKPKPAARPRKRKSPSVPA